MVSMKKIKIFVPSGIGDVVWALTKVPDIKEKNRADFIQICPNTSSCNRVEDLLYHFNFVNHVQYEEFDIQPVPVYIPPTIPGIFDSTQFVQNQLIDEQGRPRFIESSGNFMGMPDSWLLIYNGYHANGIRIESWYPEYQTDTHIMKYFCFRAEELERAKYLHETLLDNKPFIVFYMGPLEGNTISGYNRNSLWTFYDWSHVASLIQVYRKDIKFLITGAKYDWHYANLFKGSLSSEKDVYVNACGLTDIGTTFALILRSQFLLSYPSGIGIVSTYLGHPTGIFFRKSGDSLSSEIYISYDDRLSDCWVPTKMIDTTYFPFFYQEDIPETISQIIGRFV